MAEMRDGPTPAGLPGVEAVHLFRLDGQVAVVTGGSSGLGRAMALGLARHGARVVVSGRDEARCRAVAAEITAAGGEAEPVVADVAAYAGCQALMAAALRRFGQIDVLVTSAGVVQSVPATEMSPEEWLRVINTDLNGVFWCCQAAGRHMVELRRGSIINIASISGLYGFRDQAAYCAAKGGVVLLTKALAVEWAPRGVRVNCIAPTWFYTPMSAGTLDDPAQRAQKLEQIPLGRVGEEGDIVGPVVFLASSAASYVTGHILAVDGGKTALLTDY